MGILSFIWLVLLVRFEVDVRSEPDCGPIRAGEGVALPKEKYENMLARGGA